MEAAWPPSRTASMQEESSCFQLQEGLITGNPCTHGEAEMTAHYEADIVAWASEQARLLRSGRFDLLDTEHIAEEIEAVGKSE